MLCSICRQIEIVLDCGEAVTCVNNHVYCPKCLAQVSGKCLICKERLYDLSAWASIHSNAHSWTPEMIREWSQQIGLSEVLSDGGLPDDIGVLEDDCEAASMNLLYSRGEAYDAESHQPSDSIQFSDTKLNHSLLWTNIYSKQHQFLESDPKCSGSAKSPARAEVNKEVEKKDTRQKLLEQTREELRKKFMDEIFKPYTEEQKSAAPHVKCSYMKQLRTIGVSTESNLKLFPDDPQLSSSMEPSHEGVLPDGKIDGNRMAPEYLLMNVRTRPENMATMPPLQDGLQKKSEASSIDLRLQQIMGILLESVKPPSKEDQQFYKFLREKFSRVPLVKLNEILSSIYNEDEDETKAEVPAPNKADEPQEKPAEPSLIPNSHRAFYNPPPGDDPDIIPSPQFQVINLFNENMSKELWQTEIIDAYTLNIPRRPVICPISTCQGAFFVSDFIKHIAVDHAKVPMESIFPQQCKNFFLDPKLIHVGTSRCQLLLLVKNKIKNLSHEKYKDFIPILVMTTKLSYREIYSNKNQPLSGELQRCTQNFIMIWLTGVMPPQLPMFFSLTVWARSGYMPICHLVYSGRLYSVRESQCPEAVRQSGQMLLLSENQIELLTNGGRNMLELQFTIH